MLDLTDELELSVASALALFTTMAVVLKTRSTKERASKSCASLSSLRTDFLMAYLPALLGDWLQGPYVYALYARLGFSSSTIAALFLVGFVSGSTLGSLTGSLADKFGRRRLTQVFCVVYAMSCLTKLCHNIVLLLIGRLLGGVATSLLFTVYEAWYVSQHKQLGLEPEAMANTFGLATFLNGIAAILAGILANLAVNNLSVGVMAPFILAVPCFMISMAVVTYRWQENYGDAESVLSVGWSISLKLIISDRRVLSLGIIQSIVESSMYVFVFLWTPMLQENGQNLPLGLIFSSFMLAIMLGSIIFSSILSKFGIEKILLLAIGLFTAACYACGLLPHYRLLCYASFLLLEFSLGLYFPSSGSLRAALVSEEHRATIANFFRVPLNLFTVSGLSLARTMDHGNVFLVLAGLMTFAFVLAKFVILRQNEQNEEKKRE